MPPELPLPPELPEPLELPATGAPDVRTTLVVPPAPVDGELGEVETTVLTGVEGACVTDLVGVCVTLRVGGGVDAVV